MADVFVSYASEDRDKAAALVEVLKAQGWSVWWDRDIPAGASWDESIQTGMTQARVMVVLWSRSSATSRMVKDEANYAANKDALVPALIEPCEIPYGYGMLQAADLTDWDGGTDHPGLVQVLTATRRQLGRKTEPIRSPPAPPWRKKRWLAPAALLAPVPLAAALGALKVGRFDVTVSARAREVRFVLAARQQLPAEQLALLELGASRLTAAALPPSESPGAVVPTSLLLLRPGATGSATLALRPIALPESATVALRVDPGEVRLGISGVLRDRVVVAVSGLLEVRARRRPIRADTFEPGLVQLQPDSGGIDLQLILADTVATLSTALQVRGLRFTRVDYYREGEGVDEFVSTLDTATVAVAAQPGASFALGRGGSLGLEEAVGEVRRLSLEPDGVTFEFDGSVGGLITGSGATRQRHRPTWFNVVTTQHLTGLVVALAIYLAAAGYAGLTLRRRR
jgi:hypothetical protein